MSLLSNRVRKIEAEIGANDSQFCQCSTDLINRMVEQIYDRQPVSVDVSTLPDGNFCLKCVKPVADARRIENLEAQINRVYGDLFAEQEKPPESPSSGL